MTVSKVILVCFGGRAQATCDINIFEVGYDLQNVEKSGYILYGRCAPGVGPLQK